MNCDPKKIIDRGSKLTHPSQPGGKVFLFDPDPDIPPFLNEEIDHILFHRLMNMCANEAISELNINKNFSVQIKNPLGLDGCFNYQTNVNVNIDISLFPQEVAFNHDNRTILTLTGKDKGCTIENSADNSNLNNVELKARDLDLGVNTDCSKTLLSLDYTPMDSIINDYVAYKFDSGFGIICKNYSDETREGISENSFINTEFKDSAAKINGEELAQVLGIFANIPAAAFLNDQKQVKKFIELTMPAPNTSESYLLCPSVSNLKRQAEADGIKITFTRD